MRQDDQGRLPRSIPLVAACQPCIVWVFHDNTISEYWYLIEVSPEHTAPAAGCSVAPVRNAAFAKVGCGKAWRTAPAATMVTDGAVRGLTAPYLLKIERYSLKLILDNAMK